MDTPELASLQGITIGVGDLEFAGLAAGPPDGDPVVLLHGFPQTSWLWRSQLRTLAAHGYRAVAPDQRGYSPGARPAGVAAYGIDHLVADVLGIADALGAERFHLVGHDWGAMVGWHVAGRHPERLRSFTALSVPHPTAFDEALRDPDSGQADGSDYFEEMLSDEMPAMLLADDAAGLRGSYAEYGELPAADIDRYVEVLAQPGALAAAMSWYRAVGFELVDGLPRSMPGLTADARPVTVPTLYIWSTLDGGISRWAADRVASCVTGPYRFEVIEGVGHWTPELAADRVDELLIEHLAAHG